MPRASNGKMMLFSSRTRETRETSRLELDAGVAQRRPLISLPTPFAADAATPLAPDRASSIPNGRFRRRFRDVSETSVMNTRSDSIAENRASGLGVFFCHVVVRG